MMFNTRYLNVWMSWAGTLGLSQAVGCMHLRQRAGQEREGEYWLVP